MKKLFVLSGLLFLLFQLSAQTHEPVEIIEGKYYYQDMRVGAGYLKSIVIDYPLAYREVRKGNSGNIWGSVLSGLGGAMLFTSMLDLAGGTTNYSSDPTMGLITGSLLTGWGVYMVIRGKHRVLNGVNIYNSSLKGHSDGGKVYWEFGSTESGIGISCRF